MKGYYLSLGGNLGDTKAFFSFAISQLKEYTSQELIVSPIYKSKSWGFKAEQDFLNCCVFISVDLTPIYFLNVLKEIEKNAGRKEKTSLNDYSSRELDIDIIYCDDLVLELEELKIPHPLRLSRNFVLVPLSDIAPDFIDPLERKSVEVLRNKCIDVVKVEKLERFV